MLDVWIDMIICIFYLLFFTTPYIVGDILQLKCIRQKALREAYFTFSKGL